MRKRYFQKYLTSYEPLHNEELHNLYSSDIIRKMKWIWHVACMGEMRNIYRILVRKSEGDRLCGRPRYRW
jgi:uncharacterized protein YqgQ